MLKLLAEERFTSLAVQFRPWLLPCACQTSWIHVWATDSWAPKSTVPATARQTAMANCETLVRHMPVFMTSGPPLSFVVMPLSPSEERRAVLSAALGGT